MNDEQMLALAEKVKAGTATNEESILYQTELNKFLEDLKGVIEEK